MKPRISISLMMVAVGLVVPMSPSLAAHDYYGVASRGSTAAAVGDSGQIIYSSHGPHRTWFGLPPYPYDFYAITTTSVGYTTCGQNGKIYRNADGDANDWWPVSSRTTEDLFGVSKAGQYLVAVGNAGTVVVGSFTSDQAPWNTADTVQAQVPLRAVAGSASFAVIVGDGGTVLWSSALNPTVWDSVSAIPTSMDLFGVAEGPYGRFWAVGAGGMILRSLPNPAEAWERIASGATASTLRAVAFFGFYGVAVGDGGTILYSNGGDSWSPVDSPTGADLNGVGYTGSGLGGGFVAVGDQGTVLWSEVGNMWSEAVVPVRSVSWGQVRQGWGPSPTRK